LALDSLQAPALANLGVIRAVRDGDTASGLAMIRRAIALAPSDPELRGAILQSVLRLDGRLDEALAEARIAGRLDPLVPLGMDREGALLLCQGHAAEALARYRDVLSLDEEFSFSRRGAVRALAALGRWDEALAEWRILARGDSAASQALEGARGEAGYWQVQQRLGLARARLLEATPGGPPSLGRLGMAWIQAGEVDRGADLLEADARGGGVQVYHLRCNEATDGRREHPRVRKLLETYGRLGTVNRARDPGRPSS
jgi:tetratricopeptide (TPR) repeat protein